MTDSPRRPRWYHRGVAQGTEDHHEKRISRILSLGAAEDDPDGYPTKLYEFIRAANHDTVHLTIEDGDTPVLPFAFTLTISSGVKFR